MAQTDWLGRENLTSGIVRIRLNRSPVNALNADFLMDYAALLEELAADISVRAVILTSPFKVFSAGLDLKEAQEFDLPQQRAIVAGLNIAFLRQYAFPKPVIAAVGGAAIAGGLFFVLAADYRIGGPKAAFGLAEVRVGADFPIGPLEIARAELSPHDLRRLMLGGKPIDAHAALAAGIIDRIETADLAQAAMDAAADYATIPPMTFAAVKRQIRGDVIEKIEQAMQNGANAPVHGWFNAETRAAMAKMIG